MRRKTVAFEIARYNAGRDPRRLERKLAAMRENAFAFLRGSCHLFYSTLPRRGILTAAPASWIYGDLHFENFGSYRGDNRLMYFDVNDFDEACLAPCTWDLVRLLSSVFVGGATMQVGKAKTAALCRIFLEAYRTSVVAGAPRWIERSLAEGMVKDLLQSVEKRKRRDFLDQRTRKRGGERKLRIDDEKALRTTREQKRDVREALKRHARAQHAPEFYRVLHVADRIAGLGSLGVERYVVLVEGRGSPDHNYLLDLKETRSSAVAAHVLLRQPEWRDQAERVITVQRCMQAASPALLRAVTIGERSFVLKELQPIEDRVDLKASRGRVRKLATVAQAMGSIAAWGHLRASGWRGAASREELADFARDGGWEPQLVKLALRLARQTMQQWKDYAEAFDDGFFTRA